MLKLRIFSLFHQSITESEKKTLTKRVSCAVPHANVDNYHKLLTPKNYLVYVITMAYEITHKCVLENDEQTTTTKSSLEQFLNER